ncbi:unnamed protein product [Bursaphelenchus okinawaensis]|uniref:Glycosyltransferase family 92 protein n=1 Tax=Bursaphelenchus okinawaensis TaxID=465554 RepID=A0A811JXL1_9BILA|nr:unnamed protein product [Bursaphelenchus okinawaensis]CAG9086567.1 unnamed protein product [Bursaphelenchus okinawaensis]
MRLYYIKRSLLIAICFISVTYIYQQFQQNIDYNTKPAIAINVTRPLHNANNTIYTELAVFIDRKIDSSANGTSGDNIDKNAISDDIVDKNVISDDILDKNAISIDIMDKNAASDNIPVENAISNNIPVETVISDEIASENAISNEILDKSAISTTMLMTMGPSTNTNSTNQSSTAMDNITNHAVDETGLKDDKNGLKIENLKNFHIGNVSFTNPKKVKDQFYIRSAFRVSNSTIRLTILRHLQNRRTLQFTFSNNTGTVKQVCNLKGCRNAYAPSCRIIGIIGTIELVDSSVNDKILKLWSVGSESIDMPIIDVRSRPPIHNLAVCLQSIFLHDETSVFIQFFEHWIAHGATKFYIYRQNYAAQIQNVLDFYANRMGIDVEYVNWSELPYKDQPNPNELIFRTEVYMNVFDCLHRARYTAKYVAQMDLDETVVVRENDTLLNIVEGAFGRNSKLATIQLKSRKGEFTDQSFDSIRDFRGISFKPFYTLAVENKFFPPPAYSKLIHRPERVLTGHHHLLTEGEYIGNTTEKYGMTVINQRTLSIIHLRRSRDNLFKLKQMAPNRSLRPQAIKWERSFRSHIQNYTGDTSTAPYSNMAEVEKCRKSLNYNLRSICGSIYFCALKLDTSSYYVAPNTWYTL